MKTQASKQAKEKEKSSTKRTTKKNIPKQPAPEIIISEEYKIKVTKYSYDLFRKQDKNLVEEDIPDDEEVEAGWTCLGHFGQNSWDRIRKEIFDDMILRKLVKLRQVELEKFSTLCEKVSKEIQKIFSSNDSVLLNKKEKIEEKKNIKK